MRTRNGFTLIELLIVISIISVLSAILLTQFNILDRIRLAWNMRTTVQLKAVERALSRYYVNHNSYPGNIYQAGINIVVPDDLNYAVNPSGNHYIQPVPSVSTTKGLINDKELKSGVLSLKLDDQDPTQLNELLFVAGKSIDINGCLNFTDGSGQDLKPPKVCRKLNSSDCNNVKNLFQQDQAQESDKKVYYTVCEAGGAMKAVIPLSEIPTNNSWYAWACGTVNADLQYWVYYCR